MPNTRKVKYLSKKNKSRYKGGAHALAKRKHEDNLSKENKKLNGINANRIKREEEEKFMWEKFLPPEQAPARPSPARPAPAQPQSFFQRIFSRPAWLKPEITNPIIEEAEAEAEAEAPAKAVAEAEEAHAPAKAVAEAKEHSPAQSQFPPNNNRFIPYNNMREIGRGASKLVMARRSNKTVVYIRPLPEDLLTPSLKTLMREDYMFSLALWNASHKYFPKVSKAWETTNTFNYTKQRCVQITNSNITHDILLDIILAVIDLIDTCRLFTFDLKPPNIGLLYGEIKFIDFGPDSSFLLKPDCDTTDYKSIVILILLVYCYNYTEIVKYELHKLARTYITGIKYQRLLDPNYSITTDPCLDLDSFNRRIAPTFETYLNPKKFLEAYSILRKGDPSNLYEIIAYFSSTLE
jgi:hypothetical protein